MKKISNAIIADFSANKTNIDTNKSIQFTNNSTGEVTSWSWDFGDIHLEIIGFVMEQHDLKQSDLVGILGDKSNVAKVLNRNRPLTLEMIR